MFRTLLWQKLTLEAAGLGVEDLADGLDAARREELGWNGHSEWSVVSGQ